MPLLCFEKRRSLTELDDGEDDGEDDMGSLDTSIWQDIPDSILLHIFSFLDVVDLGCVAQSCTTWSRVSLDESLWKGQFCSALHMTSGRLVPREKSWRGEVRRVRYHVPTVLTETITEHTDEVLHVSFSHNGKLFSTTSKDATLKVWKVGYPTTLKYSKDFRKLLGWDFTQFSSFNESDTMVLVSSVKSTHLMDRRGYMAILSLVHDFEILRVVTMDPSQLFGAWLDDTTFLGGSVEISLDRFATTVQIEAHEVQHCTMETPQEVPEIFSASPPTVEESSGQPILTFNSETASLIKFLTVANIVSKDENDFDKAASLTVKDHDKTVAKDDLSTSDIDMKVGVGSVQKIDDVDDLSTIDIDMNVDVKCDNKTLIGSDESSTSGIPTNTEGNEANQLIDHISEVEGCTVDNTENDISESGRRYCKHSLSCVSTMKQALGDTLVCDSSYRIDLTESTLEEKHRPTTSNLELFESGSKSVGISGKRENIKKTTDPLVCDSSYRRDLTESTLEEKHRPTNLELFESCSKSMGIIGKREKIKKITDKNLILVTGEFAVALHQIGFKNVPAYSRESVLASGATPMDADDPDGFMVVNYSNNDIHIVHRNQELDMPDHLIDLFGHVTGLCLTSDQRYLFINCRPWVGDIDRSDPWATPDLSANIEVRIIDLHTLKDLGVRYKGHKGFSPPNMCCFVFLDVSQDYVASGSEDAKGYLWDRHYQSVLATYEHGLGVVNAVGFCPYNQEYLVTVSDDKTIKVWRSRSEVRRLQINMGEKDVKGDCERAKCQ